MSIAWRGVFVALLSSALTISPAAANKSLGIYQSVDRKIDFLVELCGDGDRSLCVRMLEARGSALNWHTEPYVGLDVLDTLPSAGPNRWSGVTKLHGMRVKGTVTLKPDGNFQASGCVFMVLCDHFTLVPAVARR